MNGRDALNRHSKEKKIADHACRVIRDDIASSTHIVL